MSEVFSFFGDGNEIRLVDVDPTLQALLENWEATIRDGGIGFLPRRWQARTYWYAFAPTARLRRELLGLLEAWVGPTYSDIVQRHGDLDPYDDFDTRLASLHVVPLRFEVLPSLGSQANAAKLSVRNALTTLTSLVNRRPPSLFDGMRTSVEVLDDLGHAIAARDQDLARECMVELESSADLDEANLAFLQIRIHAGMRNWNALLMDPSLDRVLSMRRPAGVTKAIQAAIYYQHIECVDRPGYEVALRETLEQLQFPVTELVTPTSPSNRAEAIIELTGRLLTGPLSTDLTLQRLLDTAASIEKGLGEHLQRIIDVFFPAYNARISNPVSAVARDHVTAEALITDLMIAGEFPECIQLGLASDPSIRIGQILVHAASRLASTKFANEVIEYLEHHDLKSEVMDKTQQLREDVKTLELLRADFEVQGWDHWFESLGSSERTLLSDTSDSWPALPAEVFVKLLDNASDDELASLGENGGEFLAAHHLLFGTPEVSKINLRLIAALALGEKASAGIRTQTLALGESLVTNDPARSVFEEALEWTAVILAKNAAATTVTWACDVLQTFTAVPASGGNDAILTFYHSVMECLRPYRTALSLDDLEALDLVAAELGTAVPAEFRAAAQAYPGEDPSVAYRYLEGKTVVLHSLAETAITRASQILKRLVPSIDVRTNSEHVGSTQLAQLSVGADYFVVVTAAAKHAATTFIEGQRKPRPVVYVNSRGSSAILRELHNVSV